MRGERVSRRRPGMPERVAGFLAGAVRSGMRSAGVRNEVTACAVVHLAGGR